MLDKGRGHDAGRHIDSYCVLDLETTDKDINNAEIVEVAAIKVRNNCVVDEFVSLVNPGIHIPESASAVNNIVDLMVWNAPTFSEIMDDFFDFLGDDIIVGYNNAFYDMSILHKKKMELKNAPFSNDYLDVMHVAKRCLGVSAFPSLESVCIQFDIDTIGEHRALKDCYLTKKCYDLLFEKYGEEYFKNTSENGVYKVKNTDETLALRELQALLNEVVIDGKVTSSELLLLQEWIEKHSDLQGNYPYDRVFEAINRVLEDGVITDEELMELKSVFSEFADPVKQVSVSDLSNVIFDNKHICLTGDFKYGSKQAVGELIISAGGILDNSVKKNTDYVVVGACGSSNWKTGNYGTKIKKALEYNEKGLDIAIVEEEVFVPAVLGIITNGKNKMNNINEVCNEEKIEEWFINTKKMLDKLIKEYELPSGSLYITKNINQKSLTFSICIWEPDYPPRADEKRGQNKIVMTIDGGKFESKIRENQAKDLACFLPVKSIVKEQSKNEIESKVVRIQFANPSDELIEYIKKSVLYCLERYSSKADSFGCCSSFLECSNAKKCVHSNKLYSKSCIYRSHLENNEIYYGTNKNIF